MIQEIFLIFLYGKTSCACSIRGLKAKEQAVMEHVFGIKGNICYSKDLNHIETVAQGTVICDHGKSMGVFKVLPDIYRDVPVWDYGDALIIPGLTDLHVHAPQFVFRALGLDMELLEWLDVNTFPQEAKYKDTAYAKKAYSLFVDDVFKGPNTRIVAFGTLHRESTEVLMSLLEEKGICAYVGKVNMDRNAPDYLCETDAFAAASDTVRWLEEISGRYRYVRPVLTPRFVPSCTDELMAQLGEIRKRWGLPVQSHLSENKSEIQWVQSLCPASSCYGDAYDRFGLFGGDYPAVMAHCVHCPENELQMMKKNGVFVAHCPQSNTNLSSGMAPVRKYLDMGLNVGLGSDVAGGYTTSILRAMADAIGISKLYWRTVDTSTAPLKLEEVFYLGTKGGGAFFGKAGSFEKDYEFDAVVIDDHEYHRYIDLDIRERLERAMYLSDDRHICGKYIQGRKLF